MAEQRPDTAMVLAAGLGKRLRPITDTMPKPLVKVGGRAMLDRALDTLVDAGIRRAVVNIHYLGQQIIDHCATRSDMDCVISDERDKVLETAGGTAKALPLIGEKTFVLLNADTFWIDFSTPVLNRMIDAFDEAAMDMLVLLARPEQATGHSGGIDFLLEEDGSVRRSPKDAKDGFIYAGAIIMHPRALAGATATPHSLNVYFDKAIEAGRFFGVELGDGHWFTVGTPQGLDEAEAALLRLQDRLSD